MLMHGPNVLGMVALASLLLPTVVFADQPAAEDCVGSIAKESDLNNALKCKEIHLGPLTVTSGKMLGLELRPGTTVKMLGDITFDNYKGQMDAMMYVKGVGYTFLGNNRTIIANGDKHWPKILAIHIQPVPYNVPGPAVLILGSGRIQDLTMFNSPRQAFGINNQGALTVYNVNVDNSAGEGRAVNTDGMDIKSYGPLEITGCTISCQDDCIAISVGDKVNINSNTCHRGHGLSVGSVRTGDKVTNIRFAFNRLYDPDNGLRIKTMINAQNAIVDSVIYEGNVATNVRHYGFVLAQNYTNDKNHGQTPTSGVKVDNVHFIGNNQINVAPGGMKFLVVCGANCVTKEMGLTSNVFSGGSPGEVHGVVSHAIQAELSLIQSVSPQTKSTPVWSPAPGHTGSQQTKPSAGTQRPGTKKGQSGSHSSSHHHRHQGPGHSGSSGAPSFAAIQQHRGIQKQRRVNHHHHKHHHSHPPHQD